MDTLATEGPPAGTVTIALAGPTDTELLDAFVHNTPRASHYHLSGWRRLIGERFGHRCYCLLARTREGTITGLLPLVRLRSRLFGDYMVSMPYVNYGGAVALDHAVEQRLMSEAVTLAGEVGTGHVEFRDQVTHAGDYVVRTDKVAMIRSLPGNVDDLWRDLGAKLRSQIKRPLRDGAVVVRGGLELLGEFYQVFAHNMRDLGTPVYGRDFFRAILQRFPDAASITLVRMGSQPVAAAFLLRHQGRTEVPWASSLRSSNHLGVNMLLYWGLLEQAVQEGRHEFDFGRSSRGGGTWRFKQQWGAQERPLYWHYWVAPGRPAPGLRTDNPRFALAIRLWQRLPLSVANTLGPHLVKNLP